MRLLRIVLAFSSLLFSTLACNLSNTATQPSNLRSPVIGLQPTSGAPGTLIGISVGGFTPGAQVSLLALMEGSTSPTVLARDLTISQAGDLNFGLTLPPQIGNVPLTRTLALTLTVTTADQRESASAVFVAIITATTPTTTLASTPVQGSISGGGSGGAVTNFFITAPAIGSVHSANQITVTGSGANYDNQVNVQLQDINNNIIAGGTATIQSAAGTVGVWQVTIPFTQPAQRSDGYIYAFTLSQSGQIAQASSIPIIYAGGTIAGVTATVVVNTPVSTILPIPILITSTPIP